MARRHLSRRVVPFVMHLHKWLFRTSVMVSGSFVIKQWCTIELARFDLLMTEFGSRDPWIFYHPLVLTHTVVVLFPLNFMQKSVWHIGIWKMIETIFYVWLFFILILCIVHKPCQGPISEGGSELCHLFVFVSDVCSIPKFLAHESMSFWVLVSLVQGYVVKPHLYCLL
jgi:hypothetical protein